MIIRWSLNKTLQSARDYKRRISQRRMGRKLSFGTFCREFKIKWDCSEDERPDHAAVQQCAGGAVEAAV